MAIIVSVILMIFTMGQGVAPKHEATPDGFMGLTLNVTTVDDTIARLGPADAEKVDKLEASKLEKWLDPRHKEKIFKQLIYKKSPDFTEMKLAFMDGKLVMIDLTFKKRVAVERLRGLFRANFVALGGPINLPDKPGEYPPGGFLATGYPAAYAAVAISDETFIVANCLSEGGGSSPGRIDRTRQFSRVLQRKTS